MTEANWLDAPMRAEIVRAAAVLAGGGLVAIPTETVYGLGADARNRAAIKRIFTAKRRPADHPLIVHLASAEQLVAWCSEVPPSAWLLAKTFWPGPMTLILKRNRRVPEEVTGGQDTIGLRVPAHPVALELLRAFGGGVAAPSANLFGHVSPTTAAHVRAQLGAEIDLILDGGACTVGIESTIVDLTGTQPRILRPGGIGRAQVEAVLGVALLPDTTVDTSRIPRVSGSLASHYAPNTPVRWVDAARPNAALRDAALLAAAADVGAVGVIALTPPAADMTSVHRTGRVEWRSLSADPAAYARGIYARLRELDERGLDLIVLEVPPDTAAWEAVRDRLRRAAGPS